MANIEAVYKVWWGSHRFLNRLLVVYHDEWVLEKFFNCDSLVHVQNEAVFQEVSANLCYSRWESWWLSWGLDYLHYYFSVFSVLYPGWLAWDHFDYATAKWPDIRRLSSALAIYYFWSHPVGRAFYFAVCHSRFVYLQIFVTNRDADLLQLGWRAEIGQLNLALCVNEDVCALEIPMHDVFVVQVPETLHDLDCVNPDKRLVKWAESV